MTDLIFRYKSIKKITFHSLFIKILNIERWWLSELNHTLKYLSPFYLKIFKILFRMTYSSSTSIFGHKELTNQNKMFSLLLKLSSVSKKYQLNWLDIDLFIGSCSFQIAYPFQYKSYTIWIIIMVIVSSRNAHLFFEKLVLFAYENWVKVFSGTSD